MAHLTAEQQSVLDTAMARYVAALSALDEQAFLSCFRNNCVVRDPYGISIYRGGDELRQYFQTLKDTWQAFTITPGQVYYGGHERIVFLWVADATAKNGKSVRYEGVNVLTLEGDLIDELESAFESSSRREV